MTAPHLYGHDAEGRRYPDVSRAAVNAAAIGASWPKDARISPDEFHAIAECAAVLARTEGRKGFDWEALLERGRDFETVAYRIAVLLAGFGWRSLHSDRRPNPFAVVEFALGPEALP